MTTSQAFELIRLFAWRAAVSSGNGGVVARPG
jgi:hypothetical protein